MLTYLHVSALLCLLFFFLVCVLSGPFSFFDVIDPLPSCPRCAPLHGERYTYLPVVDHISCISFSSRTLTGIGASVRSG